MTDHIVEANKKVIDLDALEKLADEASKARGLWDEVYCTNKFHDYATPATIKALIAELREARGLLSESADLTGLCTTPDRFSECGTGEVFLCMTAHNAKARAFLARNGKGEGG